MPSLRWSWNGRAGLVHASLDPPLHHPYSGTSGSIDSAGTMSERTLGPLMPKDVREALHPEHLSMSHLAAHYAGRMNGVSVLNAEVAHTMFEGRSIEGITNGVHHLTWTSDAMATLFDSNLPGWREDPQLLAQAVHRLSDDHLEELEPRLERHSSPRSSMRLDRSSTQPGSPSASHAGSPPTNEPISSSPTSIRCWKPCVARCNSSSRARPTPMIGWEGTDRARDRSWTTTRS